MSANKETVQHYMAAYARWDHAAVLACLTEDVEWIVPGAFHLVGKDAFDQEIEGRGSAGPPEITVSRLVVEDDVVVAEGTSGIASRTERSSALCTAMCS